MCSSIIVLLTVLTFASLTAGVASQESGRETSTAASSIPSISPCGLGCITGAASSAGCTSFTDLSCVCTNTKFQSAAATCLQTKCTADEQAAVLALQQQECSNISSSASATSTPTSSSPSTTDASTSGTDGLEVGPPPSPDSLATPFASIVNAAVAQIGPITFIFAVAVGFISIAL